MLLAKGLRLECVPLLVPETTVGFLSTTWPGSAAHHMPAGHCNRPTAAHLDFVYVIDSLIKLDRLLVDHLLCWWLLLATNMYRQHQLQAVQQYSHLANCRQLLHLTLARAPNTYIIHIRHVCQLNLVSLQKKKGVSLSQTAGGQLLS
eukprot:GHUV01051175.1.p1 GENE.GHUV01051175.1~~GHUV01051175.1.p1  ORF type:complete len:147 (+),score=28.08 GHUV01051175.1:72-512(+)